MSTKLKKLLREIPRDPADDWYTIDEFLACCQSGSFIDDDGGGFYATESSYFRNLPAIPSLFRKGLIWDGFTHVAWFNK